MVLGKVVETLIAQDEARWAAALKQRNPNWTEEQIQEAMAQRKRDGNCLFVFAMVCKPWREGGPAEDRGPAAHPGGVGRGPAGVGGAGEVGAGGGAPQTADDQWRKFQHYCIHCC